MDSKYFKDKIYLELKESCDYMKKSLDYIKSYPKWSNVFRNMSDERYNHAEQLYKIFIELYLNSDTQKTYLNSIRDSIIEIFISETKIIDGYKATYDLITNSIELINKEEIDDG